MTSQQLSGIWDLISHIGLPILFVVLFIGFIIELVRVQQLSGSRYSAEQERPGNINCKRPTQSKMSCSNKYMSYK